MRKCTECNKIFDDPSYKYCPICGSHLKAAVSQKVEEALLVMKEMCKNSECETCPFLTTDSNDSNVCGLCEYGPVLWECLLYQ